jgi:hypothetical protein
MIKYITATLILLTATISSAQNNGRADTTLLGIYSTGAGFTLTRADFGTQTATDILTDMVRAYDTVQVSKTVADTARTRIKHSYEKRCNNLSELVTNRNFYKDKIVLMELNKDCDVTQTCLLAQRAGAKAFVFIHNSNSNGNIHLPKQGVYKDSIRIPIFCVGKEKGQEISALLPSKAAIKTKVPPPATLNRVANDSTNVNVLLAKMLPYTEGGITAQDEQTTTNAELANGIAIGKQGFSVSPNPTRNQTNVAYQFLKPTDVTVEVKTASGQVIFSKILRGVSAGSLEIPTVDYANGTYFVTLQYEKEVQTKKLIVRH